MQNVLAKITSEQIEIRRTVRQFAEKEIKPIALARDREEHFDKRFPWHVLAKAEKLGLRTLALSENKGGGGADALTDCIVAEELATADVGVAATLNHTSDLARLFFDHYMTDEQPGEVRGVVEGGRDADIGGCELFRRDKMASASAPPPPLLLGKSKCA